MRGNLDWDVVSVTCGIAFIAFCIAVGTCVDSYLDHLTQVEGFKTGYVQKYVDGMEVWVKDE